MTTHQLKTQKMVKLELSTNYDTRVTVQIWRETIQQTQNICKYKNNNYIQQYKIKINKKINKTIIFVNNY